MLAKKAFMAFLSGAVLGFLVTAAPSGSEQWVIGAYVAGAVFAGMVFVFWLLRSDWNEVEEEEEARP